MISRIKSLAQYQSDYERSVANPEQYWEEIAKTFQWQQPWSEVLKWEFNTPSVEWFRGAKLNITENCLDRHLADKANEPAISWVPNELGEPTQVLTYLELHTQVCKAANMLQSLGVQEGDRVALYMPMVPELAIAVLACARVGAIHSVIFAGFSAQALADRIEDAHCKIVLTSDGAFRGAKQIPLKSVVDQAIDLTDCVEHVVVVERTSQTTAMESGRDHWWHDLMEQQSSEFTPVYVDAQAPLFILYTSGSTGKPKGVVHAMGGYMVYAEYSFVNVFQYDPGDVYWCTADIGWITGHTYIVYGPLLAGAHTVMYEGVPTYPDGGRFWQICQDLKVNQFYTAPTAIRALQALVQPFYDQYDLSSLKVLGSVGEPINEEAWEWYHHNIGKENCPIVDTWWQTETGGILISPLAGITPLKPSYATLPLPGIQPVIVDAEGNTIEGNDVEGNLCMAFPWPSLLRTTWGDHDRCHQTYFSTFPGKYFTGDGCKRDAEGMYRITGRVDDVINVSGHRFGTAEIEDAIDQHPQVVEAAVVGYPHEIKGQGIYAYVICETGVNADVAFETEIRQTVNQRIGPIAKPDKIQIVPGLPKTRSGKIMRRILRKVAAGETENLGDTSTLLDPAVVEIIKSGAK